MTEPGLQACLRHVKKRLRIIPQPLIEGINCMAYPIITIAREYGSGGRLIGVKLAEDLGIPFYDKNLILLAAKDSGLDVDFVRRSEHKRTGSFFYDIFMDSNTLPISDQVFLSQAKVIHQLAENGPCVIVGRCADYVLRDRSDCMNIFIHAPLSQRMRRVKEEYLESSPDIAAYIHKQDKDRASYYSYYTQYMWGDTHRYHLSVNSTMGIPTAVALLKLLASSFGGSET